MTLIIIITIVVLLALYVISVNNKYVRLKNQSEEAGSALDAHLKQRYDLVPNLVETVKGYASHEQKTLTAVIEARNKAVASPTLEARDEADKAFSSALRSLFALSEAYPELKANQGFLDVVEHLPLLAGVHHRSAEEEAVLFDEGGFITETLQHRQVLFTHRHRRPVIAE